MNAYELADLMLDVTDMETSEYYQAGMMLRQQADRIVELEKQSKFQGDNKVNNEPVAWINEDNFLLGDVLNSAVYRTKPNEKFTIPLYTHPAKTLTDEVLMQLYEVADYSPESYLEEAKAILRKAQEK